jgi:hypothetical protein
VQARYDLIPDDVHEAAMKSLETPITSTDFARSMVKFMTQKRIRSAA